MKKLLALLSFILLISTSSNLQAQNRFSATLSAGYGTGAYELSYTGLGLGKFAFRVDLSYAIIPILDAYAGYGRTGFACQKDTDPRLGSFCTNENPAIHFTSSGLNIGLRLHHRPDASIWIPYLRAGVVYQFLDISQNGESYNYSGIGFEVGTGIVYPLTEQIGIMPSINYKRYGIEQDNGDKSAVVIISGLVGLRYSF